MKEFSQCKEGQFVYSTKNEQVAIEVVKYIGIRRSSSDVPTKVWRVTIILPKKYLPQLNFVKKAGCADDKYDSTA